MRFSYALSNYYSRNVCETRETRIALREQSTYDDIAQRIDGEVHNSRPREIISHSAHIAGCAFRGTINLQTLSEASTHTLSTSRKLEERETILPRLLFIQGCAANGRILELSMDPKTFSDFTLCNWKKFFNCESIFHCVTDV